MDGAVGDRAAAARVENAAGGAESQRVVVIEVAPVFDRAAERPVRPLDADREGRVERLLDAQGQLILVGGLETDFHRLALEGADLDQMRPRRKVVVQGGRTVVEVLNLGVG